MFYPGLVSITFRDLSPKEIVELVAKAKLKGIEWGSDVHVPVGELQVAREVARMTKDAGLESAAYGSYFRMVENSTDEFARVIDSAQALGTSLVRVWVGGKGSEEADADYRQQVVEQGRTMAEMATAADMTIACEWHGGTLTDTDKSASDIITQINHPAFQTYWQPRSKRGYDFCIEDMDAALPHLVGVHVFNWHPETAERLPLAEDDHDWPQYFSKVKDAIDFDIYALIEFVKDGNPQQFLEDAAVLREWLLTINS